MKLLLVAVLVAAMLAGCGAPSSVALCAKDAPPSISYDVYMWTSDTAMMLQKAGWVNIQVVSEQVVTADCHLSVRWVP